METQFFVAHDGNPYGLFETYLQAEHFVLRQQGWTDSEITEEWEFVKKEANRYGGDPFSNNGRHSLWFITELKLSDGVILEVDCQLFDDYIESISDEPGTKEFEDTKRRMNQYYLGERNE